MRPFGALFFGRLGDLIGRKYTFLVTMTVMGIATFVVGLLPGYATIGIAAPVAVHRSAGCCRAWRSAASMAAPRPTSPSTRPQGRRGFYTSWIQTTATVGLFLSLLVILGLRLAMTPEAFARLGLADAVPGLDPPARVLDLDPAAARRIAGLHRR